MTRDTKRMVLSRIMGEEQQAHDTRKHLFLELEQQLGMPVVSIFTSFNYPVMLGDDDVTMLEAVLRDLDTSKGLALCINSPGGDGIAAERMINVCRSFSRTGDYIVIVPGKAKSAATIVCFGASKILMTPTSELGPIDPQVIFEEDDKFTKFSVYNIIDSYEALFKKAVKEDGNLQPYLQQLARYDEREIRELRDVLKLSSDIAVRALSSGMMKGQSVSEIQKKIKVFLTPIRTMNHSRPIYFSEAKTCGLKVDLINHGTELANLVYELYIRTDTYVSKSTVKCIESKDYAFALPRK